MWKLLALLYVLCEKCLLFKSWKKKKLSNHEIKTFNPKSPKLSIHESKFQPKSPRLSSQESNFQLKYLKPSTQESKFLTQISNKNTFIKVYRSTSIEQTRWYPALCCGIHGWVYIKYCQNDESRNVEKIMWEILFNTYLLISRI